MIIKFGGIIHFLWAYWGSPPTYDICNTQYEKMQNEANSTNVGNKLKAPPKAAQLNNQSSIIDNQLKGKPNFTKEYASRVTRNENMQNEPNFKLTAKKPTSPNGSRATGHERRLNMQNEPNFTTPKLEIRCRFASGSLKNVLTFSHNVPTFPQKYPKKRTLFHLFYPPKTAFRHVFKVLDLNTLNLCITMAYINIHPRLPFASHEKRDTEKSKTNQIQLQPARNESRDMRDEKMQNKPNFNTKPGHFDPERGPRVTRDESRFNMQNEPNFNQECIPEHRDSSTHSPIHSFTHTLIYAKQTQFKTQRLYVQIAQDHDSRIMQNEPNFKHNDHIPTRHGKIQNKSNLIPSERKYSINKGLQKYSTLQTRVKN